MEDFTRGLNSAIDIIEQGVTFELRYVPACYLLQAYGYDRKDKSCQRLLKSKLTEKYDNSWLFVTVERSRPITIISLASLESHQVSNFVDKAILLKQDSLKRYEALPGHQPLINLEKILEDHPRVF